jgi:endonuclease YncB( thermonuclease family)
MHFKTKSALPPILLLAAWLMSCADVPSTGPTPPELLSQFRFVHAAGDLGDVGVAVDGSSIGSLAFKGALPYREFPAGSRVAVLSNGDTLRVAMESYKRGTVLILPKTGPAREFVKLNERRVFDPVNTGEAWLRVVHAAEAPEVDVRIAGVDTTITLSAAAYRAATDYLRIPEGNYTIRVAAAGDTTALLTFSLSAVNKRQTSVILGSVSAGTLALINLADD